MPDFPSFSYKSLNISVPRLRVLRKTAVNITAMMDARQRFSAVHTTTPIFHGWGLARFGAACFGSASGGGVGPIQSRLPIGGFAWVHGVSLDFW
jgi:hypothetical protein